MGTVELPLCYYWNINWKFHRFLFFLILISNTHVSDFAMKSFAASFPFNLFICLSQCAISVYMLYWKSIYLADLWLILDYNREGFNFQCCKQMPLIKRLLWIRLIVQLCFEGRRSLSHNGICQEPIRAMLRKIKFFFIWSVIRNLPV